MKSLYWRKMKLFCLLFHPNVEVHLTHEPSSLAPLLMTQFKQCLEC